MTYLDLDAFGATALTTEPFNYLVVPGFIRQQALRRINADYPDIAEPGGFPVGELTYGAAFREFLGELESQEFRVACEKKFEIVLAGRPTAVIVRGRSGAKDGQIHTDSPGKIITVLIYLNLAWEAPGGRLRLLRSQKDLDDVLTEIPPIDGTLLAFKRAENSWHGHRPFFGVRRVIQLNWLMSGMDLRVAMLRHHAFTAVKRIADALPSRDPSAERRGAPNHQR